MIPNQQQAMVIAHRDGPCLVTAVPGSGKTTAVTERIKSLIKGGLSPLHVLAITFTNKAANEMRIRVAKAVGDEASSRMTICTFHSLCVRILRNFDDQTGLGRDFSIYDSDDQERLLKTCVGKVEGDEFRASNTYWSNLMGYLEGSRNSCMNDEEAREEYDIDGRQPAVIKEYFAALTKANALDFTGLLSETLRFLKATPHALRSCQKRWRYISVDEVQDTNVAQYEIIKLLGGHQNVLCVGDLDQSLYAFRGAVPENILRFEKEFPGCKVLRLETNYRSTPEILRHAQSLIVNNKLRKDTVLKTENPHGPVPSVHACSDTDVMADRIARGIKSLVRKGVPAGEIAVFYRTNFLSRDIESALRREQIKYKILGGMSFYQRTEIKVGMAILKIANNPSDRMSFERAVDACCNGVGPRSMARIASVPGSIMDAARSFAAGDSTQAMALRPFMNAIGGVIDPGDMMLGVARRTALWAKLEKDSTTRNDRCENLRELARDVSMYIDRGNTLSGYLQSISLLSSMDERDGGPDAVKLMTLHGAKGLEFDAVFLSHLNAQYLPHPRALAEAGDDDAQKATEEERRLLYVGMTRARKFLSLCYALRRVEYRGGRRSHRKLDPSPFLFETGLVESDQDERTSCCA